MTKIIEPAIDPNNRISFLLDWEVTMKCNLDCSYCLKGLYAGHDNTTKHPEIKDCISTIDFMYKYVDLYMDRKINGIKYVILNVYGGESLHHPNIVEILTQARSKYHESYKDRWHLTVTTTTNAIVSEKKLQQIIPLVDEFTCSFHSEATDKQKQQFKDNVLLIKSSGRRVRCVILMHGKENLFNESLAMIEWCKQNNISYLARQIDHQLITTDFTYNNKQVTWFKNLYNSKSKDKNQNLSVKQVLDRYDLSATGRACCGGRQLCQDSDYKNRTFFVDNVFTDWFCSVNEFFLYIKQVNGEIYTNKDCKMNYNGNVGPIGTLNDSNKLLQFIKNNLDNNSLPAIQCKKNRCFCGVCAPKADNLTDFNLIMKKYYKK
jgi:pyruvate-formate lyase-activating enzyme